MNPPVRRTLHDLLRRYLVNVVQIVRLVRLTGVSATGSHDQTILFTTHRMLKTWGQAHLPAPLLALVVALAGLCKRLPSPLYRALVTVYLALVEIFLYLNPLSDHARGVSLGIRNLARSVVARTLAGWHVVSAESMQAAGDFAGARRQWEKVSAICELPTDMMRSYAAIEAALGNWTHAVELLAKLRKQLPDDVRLWQPFVQSLLESGDVERARREAADALDSQPHQIQYILEMAHLFREFGHHEDAVGLYRFIQARGPLMESNAANESSGFLSTASEYAGSSLGAERWTSRFNRWREREARKHYGESNIYRPMRLGPVAGSLGDFASRIDALLKLRALGMLPAIDTELYLAPGQSFANAALVDLARPLLRIHQDPRNYEERDAETPWYGWRDFLEFALADGRVVHNTLACAIAEREWQRQGRLPLFALPAKLAERGRNALRRAGIGAEDWFVALHVREPGYYKERGTGRSALSLHRNADIRTYEKAVDWITARGGWVIRMGDPSMSPAPFRNERFLDYAHSELRSDWMDMFLIGASRYLLCTNSGPMCVAAALGTRAGITNYLPIAMPPLSPRNLFAPKMLRRKSDGRYLTFTEMLEEPFRMANRHHLFELFRERLGIELVDNSEDDILALVQELDQAAEDGLAPDPRDAVLEKIFDQRGCEYIARISPAFLNKFAAHGCLEDRCDDGLRREWGRIGRDWLRLTPQEFSGAAMRAHAQGDIAQARSLCEALLEVEPDHTDARHLRALCRRDGGDPDRAMADLAQLCAENPVSPALKQDYSALLWTAGRFKEAIAVRRELLAAAPTFLPDWLELGHQLVSVGREVEAVVAYAEPARRVIEETAPAQGNEGVLAAACEYAGDPYAARRWVAAYEKRRDEDLERYRDKHPGPTIISLGRLGTRIGDIAARFDLLCKGNLLGALHPNLRLEHVVVDGSSGYVNDAYVALWRDLLPFATPGQQADFRDAAWIQHRDLADIRMADGRTLYYPFAYSVIEQAWRGQQREPVVRMPKGKVEAGWRSLARFGVREGDWFVALHVRETGFHNESAQGRKSEAQHRTADIANYRKAVDFVLDQGGWVVRLGDPSMSPLPFERPRLIDYARSAIRSQDMDLFLMSQCRYLLGTNSGPLAVCTSFGVPCGLTNYLPIAFPACSPRNLVLPKMMWNGREDRYLTLAEMLSPPIHDANRAHIFRLLEDEFALSLRENSAEELLQFAQELHAWAASEFEPDRILQSMVESEFASRGAMYISPFADSFIRRYAAQGCFESSRDGTELAERWAKLAARRDLSGSNRL